MVIPTLLMTISIEIPDQGYMQCEFCKKKCAFCIGKIMRLFFGNSLIKHWIWLPSGWTDDKF